MRLCQPWGPHRLLRPKRSPGRLVRSGRIFMQTTYQPQPSFPVRLQALRAACPLLNSAIYLANCSQGPLSTAVHTALGTFLDQWARLGMHWDAWVEEVERARAAFAALIGATPGEIAVGSSVSQLVSSVASALHTLPHGERRRVV